LLTRIAATVNASLCVRMRADEKLTAFVELEAAIRAAKLLL
jgi:hypothetical protein